MIIETPHYSGPAIYCISNIENDKLYIGQAYEYNKRLKAHINSFKGNYHCNKYLQRAFNNSSDVLVASIIETPSLQELDNREIFWISFLNTTSPERGYNLSKGGSNIIYRPPYTEERRTRRSEITTQLWKEGVFKPIKHSRETRELMSRLKKERFLSTKKAGEIVQVIRISTGNLLGTYNSLKEVGNTYNIIYETLCSKINRKSSIDFINKDIRITRDSNSRYVKGVFSEEDRKVQSEKRKLLYKGKVFEKSEAVNIISIDTGNILNTFNSIKEAANFVNYCYPHVTSGIRAGNGKFLIAKKGIIIEKINR